MPLSVIYRIRGFSIPLVQHHCHTRGKSICKVGLGPCQQFKAQQPFIFQPCRHWYPQKAKFLLVRWWVQLPSTDTSALQGAARGLLKVQKAPCAVPWHFGSPLPLPAPHFRVSSPTEDVTQLPVKLCQNHGILQPSANQLCLQFTFICQPEMVLVLMQVRVLRHCLINFWIQVLGALKLSSKSNSPRFLVTLTCLL